MAPIRGLSAGEGDMDRCFAGDEIIALGRKTRTI